MSAPQPFHPSALEEFYEAVSWYEDQRAGLGLEFMDLVTLAMAKGALLRIPLKRFPFTLIIEERSDAKPLILAVKHQRRQPGYWLDRASDGRRRRP